MSAPINEAIKADAQELGHKVFVGNLLFSTNDSDLKAAFGGYGTISDAQIIHRGSRSLGYGFVTFKAESDAIKAIQSLDKTELSGRKIIVELAKPPTASAAGRAPRAAADAAIQSGATHGEVVVDENGQHVNGRGGGEARKRKPKPRGNRGGGIGATGSRRPRTDDETEEAGDAPVRDLAAGLASTNLNAGEETPNGGGAAEVKAARKSVDGRRSNPRPTGPPAGPLSKTQLFIANLPFSMLDDELSGLVSSVTGCKVVESRVVKKNHGFNAGRSKGFGFITLESEEEQQKTLHALDGKDVEGRVLQVKIAVEQKDRSKAGAVEESGVTPAL